MPVTLNSLPYNIHSIHSSYLEVVHTPPNIYRRSFQDPPIQDQEADSQQIPYTLAKTTKNTGLREYRPSEPPDRQQIPFSKLQNFTALLRGRELQGLYRIKVNGDQLEAQHPESSKSFKITWQNLVPEVRQFKDADLGNVTVPTEHYVRDFAMSRLLPSQDTLDRKIGTLDPPQVILGKTKDYGEAILKVFNKIGSGFILSANFQSDNGIVDKPLHPYFRKLTKLFSSPQKKQIDICLGITNDPENQHLLHAVKGLGANPFNIYSKEKTPVYVHAKLLVGSLKKANTTYSGLITTANITNNSPTVAQRKLDALISLPPKAATLLYKYVCLLKTSETEAQQQDVTRRKLLNSLAKEGVVINDPVIQHHLLTRAVVQLIRESNHAIEAYFSSLEDVYLTQRLLQKVKQGVKVSLDIHDIASCSVEEIFKHFHTELEERKISLEDLKKSFSSQTSNTLLEFDNFTLFRQCRKKEGLPREDSIHANILTSDNGSRTYVGTAYPWTSMNFSRLHQDLPVLDIGCILGKDQAKGLLKQAKKFSTNCKKACTQRL
ncbi:MAG: hypothetical protein ACKO34_06265 [Vampirovibrionales bacterium]